MYNRYIPQPDGTYRRNRIQDPPKSPAIPSPTIPPPSLQPPAPPREPDTPCSRCMHSSAPRRPAPQREIRRKENSGIGTFFKQLLPKSFDTEDLLIILLLLLMAGDSQEEQNNALLTLALYLFL